MSDWLKKDKLYNWHPYTQEKIAKSPLVITKGKGCSLFDENGDEYLDGIASWWCNPFGHCHPYIVEKMTQQLQTLEHVLFGGVTHPYAIELSERLVGILPENQKRIFYSDNGSTAIEVGIKMALQYFYNKGIKRTKLLAFEGAFHGDTFAAMATSGIGFFTEAFKESFIEVERIPVPTNDNFLEVKKLLEMHLDSQEFAAFVFEPLVLGAAGMKMYPSEYLDALVDLCKNKGTLCIADEVMTGFGRTGKMFASDHLQNKPDIICLSKALTGGFLPMAATSCTSDIYDAFYDDDLNKTFFHGHTYTANPLGCSAALAVLDLFEKEAVFTEIERIHQKHLAFKERLDQNPKVKNTRVLGVILAFELNLENASVDIDTYGAVRNNLYDFFIENKLILRPLGNTVYCLPAYCVSDIQLEKVYTLMLEAVETLV